MKTAKLSVLPIKDLNPAEYNPRKKLKPGDKEYEKIKNSIMEFGFADPVVVNSDMTIIGGHQRVTVLQDLGYDEIAHHSGVEDEDSYYALSLIDKHMNYYTPN